MNWTPNPPSEEGFYWCFHNAIGTCKLLDVFWSKNSYFARDVIMQEHDPIPVSGIKDAQWFGPIEPPKITKSEMLVKMDWEKINPVMFILKDKSR